ncbi:MAG: tetratricopeptide repeat protein, partial [Candidatus Eisenbacteria bacterium]|nr:tetratricopeptide repeat protein [Candidatus Eisenbacteria bacterium]
MDPLEIRRRLRDLRRPLTPESLSELRDAIAPLYLSEPSRALELSALLLKKVESAGEDVIDETFAITWRCRAEACLYAGRLPDALAAYRRAVAAAEASGRKRLLGQILVGQTHALGLSGEGKAAARLSSRAERLLKQAGDAVYLGKLYMNRGNAFYHDERYPEAYRAYRKAAPILRAASGEDATWIALLINQAVACTHLGRMREAERLFLQTQEKCDTSNLASLGAHARFNYAFLQLLRGEFRRALTLLDES